MREYVNKSRLLVKMTSKLTDAVLKLFKRHSLLVVWRRREEAALVQEWSCTGQWNRSNKTLLFDFHWRPVKSLVHCNEEEEETSL